MKKIKEFGGDTWIFEDSEVGDFGNPCDRPVRFHYARQPWPEEFEVIWVALVKGADRVTVGATEGAFCTALVKSSKP